MKATILSGLVALALGAFTTSCSNILEENGVLNSAAQSGMGELRINLTTDASLNVSTKGGEGTENVEIGSKTYAINKDNFDITAILKESESNTTVTGKASTFPKNVVAGKYTVTATYDQMGEQTLNWDKPSFSGTKDVQVSTITPGTAEISASLTNSIVSIDSKTFTDFLGKASVEKLYVYAGEKPADNKTGAYDLINTENGAASLKTGEQLFVKNGQKDVHIYIQYKLNNSDTLLDHISSIGTSSTTESGAAEVKTVAAKQYSVKYQLNEDNGSLQLKITIDKTIETVDINVPINPYPTTPVTPAAE